MACILSSEQRNTGTLFKESTNSITVAYVVNIILAIRAPRCTSTTQLDKFKPCQLQLAMSNQRQTPPPFPGQGMHASLDEGDGDRIS